MAKMWWSLAALNLAAAALNWYFAAEGHVFNLAVAILNTAATAWCVYAANSNEWSF